MIITEIYKGQGLGNQLACYITTRVIALDKGYDFGIMHPENFKGADFFNLDYGNKIIGGKGPEGGPAIELPQGIKYYYNERRIIHPENSCDIGLYDDDLTDILDNTKIDGIMQGEEYFKHHKDKIRLWLNVKKEYECYDYANENTCVINFRGGEYTRHKDFFLDKNYWINAVKNMLKINPDFKFIVITDDVYTAKKFFPNYEVKHFSIAKDYVIIKNAKYLILSNSSFAWFPAWLNENLKYCIAPKYWGRYNISDGYWNSPVNITKGWMYQDRESLLSDYDTCIEEFEKYKENHKNYYPKIKIDKNFLVISNHNNDLRWVPKYTENYIIYDKGENSLLPNIINNKKVIKSPNIGYNFYDYFTYIIDNYDNLPENIIFAKGNVFPRHVSKEYFERIMNNEYFTSIEECKMHKPQFPIAFFSADGGFCEINNSWYIKHHPIKYFANYNDFLRFVYKDPVIPLYTRFAPGGNYIISKKQILKLPKIIYENLRMFISYCSLPGEAHIIERAIYTLWNSNFELSNEILKKLDENFCLPPKSIKEILIEKSPKKIKNFIKFKIITIKNIISNVFN